MIAARAGGFATAVEGGFPLGDERRKSRAQILQGLIGLAGERINPTAHPRDLAFESHADERPWRRREVALVERRLRVAANDVLQGPVERGDPIVQLIVGG